MKIRGCSSSYEPESKKDIKKANAVYQCTCPACKAELEFGESDIEVFKNKHGWAARVRCECCHNVIFLPGSAERYVSSKKIWDAQVEEWDDSLTD